MSTYETTEIVEHIVSSIFIFMFMLFIPIFGLFFYGGITDRLYFDRVTFYGMAGFASFIVLTMLSLGEILTRKQPSLKKGLGWMRGVIHDPEVGLLSKIKTFKPYLRVSYLVHASIIIFGFLSIIGVISNTAFVATPGITEFSIAPTGKMILETEPASSSETLLFMVPFSLIIGFTWWISNRQKDTTSKYVMVISGMVLSFLFLVLGWVAYHTARYSGSDVSLLGVGLFALVGWVLVWLTGSAIPWWILHVINNLVSKANILFADDRVILFIIAFEIMYIALVFIWYLLIKKKMKSLLGKSFNI